MQTRLAVPDISCDGCKATIEGALRALSGVEAVEVDLAGRLVDVAHDAQIGPVQLAEAVEEQGYEVVAREEVA